jgi:hypothetical protein
MRIGRRSSTLLRSDRFARDFVLVRQAVGIRDSDGRWIAGAENSENLKGLVCKATDAERSQLQMAERLSEAITIFFHTLARDKMRPIRVGSVQTDSDVIIVDNLRWAVRSVGDWSDFGHIKITCIRLEGQNG